MDRRRPRGKQPVRPVMGRVGSSLLPVELVVLLFLPLLILDESSGGLPSAPAAAPTLVPLPHVSGAVWERRGRVLELHPYHDPPLEDGDSVLGEAWKATYYSVSGVDGGLREVSGAFFVPRGNPPAGGWPVISFAHGTTGIGHYCGPSQQDDLEGYAPVIESFLADEFAVALTDYEGLGPDGSHFYLEPRTEAFNTIDAVRALRKISQSTSARWFAVGYSQGGQAAWAANELNSYYGSGLQLQGSVAVAPGANVTGVADLARSGRLTDEQRALFPLLVVGVARYNETLDVTHFLRGSDEGAASDMIACPRDRAPANPRSRGGFKLPFPWPPWQPLVDDYREKMSLTPATRRDAELLRDALRKVALPQRPLEEPMLVITGGRDALVLQDWVHSAVNDSCAMGGQIEYVVIPDATHRSILWKSGDAVHQWIADRSVGVSVPSSCPAIQQ